MNQILKNILVFFIGCILGMSANMGLIITGNILIPLRIIGANAGVVPTIVPGVGRLGMIDKKKEKSVCGMSV